VARELQAYGLGIGHCNAAANKYNINSKNNFRVRYYPGKTVNNGRKEKRKKKNVYCLLETTNQNNLPPSIA
jgi:hypothetical protein